LALLAKYFKKLYKPTNNNLRTSSNSRNKTEDTTPRECRKPKRVKDYAYHKEKMMMCKQLHQLQSVSWLKLHQLKHGYGIEGFLILTSIKSPYS
ncbi:hypothetical protein Tco_0470150, partial [Tanacetum coccineum]